MESSLGLLLLATYPGKKPEEPTCPILGHRQNEMAESAREERLRRKT